MLPAVSKADNARKRSRLLFTFDAGKTAVNAAPQWPQNLSSGRHSAPQVGHWIIEDAPLDTQAGIGSIFNDRLDRVNRRRNDRAGVTVYAQPMGALTPIDSLFVRVAFSMMITACATPYSVPVAASGDASLQRAARRVMESDVWSARIEWAQEVLHTARRDPQVLARTADSLRAARYAALRGEDVPMGLGQVRSTAALVAELERARRQAADLDGHRGTAWSAHRSARFEWPVNPVTVSSEFGHRADPFQPHQRTFHNGIDLVTPDGAPVFSAAAGTIQRTGWRDDGCGLGVVIVHGNGYETEYCHLGTVMVERGDLVSKGSVIGRVGRTGRTTGAHLHFTVRVGGQAIDPRWMIGRSVDG